MQTQVVSLPGEPESEARRRQQIVDWWNALRISGELGATTWEVLEGIEREVTDYFAARPPDVKRAESLTAYAMLLIAGGSDL